MSLEWTEASKIKKQIINYDSFHVRWKKLVNIGALSNKVIGVHVDPPKTRRDVGQL